MEAEKTLDVRNTLIKLLLDQTIAAVVNVAAYIGGSRALRGMPMLECWMAIREVLVFCYVWTHAYIDGFIIGNVACHESGIQILAGRQSGAAPVHSSGEEDGCRKLSRNGMGSVSGIVCCPVVEFDASDAL